MPPRISLVTPNLNYGRHLGRTLDSVIGQKYPDLEYWVVDGGSTDDSQAVFAARAGGVARWISAPGLGQYAAINLGFERATGEIMGWLNSDDVLMPWTLRTVADLFAAFPEVDWIMGAPSVVQDDAVQSVATVRPLDREAVRLGLLSGGDFGLIQQESCFWRRRLWERAGPLRTDLGLAGDFELWMRFARYAEPAACTALLGGFTVHGDNLSVKNVRRYASDVERAVDTLSAHDRRLRAAHRHAIQRYHRWRGWPGLKRFFRSLGGLSEISGPVVRRDVSASTYRLARELVYP